MSLQEMKGSPFTEKYTSTKTNPSIAYKAAVKQVKTAPKGTLISAAEKTAPAIPTIAKDLVQNPFLTVAGMTSTALFGTNQEKAELLGKITPAQVTPAYDISSGIQPTLTAEQKIKEEIERQIQQNPALAASWGERTLGGTNITLPNITLPNITIPNPLEGIGNTLKEAGKWLLIGGVVIAGIWLLTRKK